MQQVIKTTYRNGVFVPHTPVDLPDGMEIEIVMENKEEVSTLKQAMGEEEKERLLRKLVENMQSNPIPMDAPRFTREELYERR